MNIAGSIPICRLKDNSTNNSIGWFNWTTTMEENPDVEYDISLDQEINVPLPTNNSARSNATGVNLLNITLPDDNNKA